MLYDVSIKGLCSRILVFRVWPWYSTWTIWVLQYITHKKSVAGGEIWPVTYSFFSNWYKPMAQWLRWVAVSLAPWVLFLISAEMLCSASAILRGTESVSAMTLALFILLQCCTLYNFFFLGFRQWLSRADRVVNLNTTIWLPLFWRTWTRARASTRPHVLAWHMGRDYSYCRASELTDSQVSGFIFSWFQVLKNTENTKA